MVGGTGVVGVDMTTRTTEMIGVTIKVRQFETGATRDLDMDKMDYEAFFSPIVLRERARFMHRNRFQKDGVVRDGDNWQKGMPQEVYMKSLFRHVMDVWTLHRKQLLDHETDLIESLCAVMFNAEGMLYEILKKEQAGQALFLMAEFARKEPEYEERVVTTRR